MGTCPKGYRDDDDDDMHSSQRIMKYVYFSGICHVLSRRRNANEYSKTKEILKKRTVYRLRVDPMDSHGL